MIVDNGALDALLFIAILGPSVILHEVAHGVVALRLGDTTARDAGRLTLNPIKHVDPFGSLVLPGMLALAQQPVFGWAKPVPVNPRRLRSPVLGMAATALAGPFTNLGIAAVLAALGPLTSDTASPACRLFYSLDNRTAEICLTTGSMVGKVVFAAVFVNVALALFNLLPIPPLDGSRLLPLFMSPATRQAFREVERWGWVILFALVFVFDGALGFLTDAIWAIVRTLA